MPTRLTNFQIKLLIEEAIFQAFMPEKKLIKLAERFEKSGDKRAVELVDEAINALAKARGALSRLNMHVSK